MKFKSIVRSISPFTGRRSDKGQRSNEKKPDEFWWDLSDVDILAALRIFYKKYNKDKVSSVEEILHHYEGEEVLMLQQLCERYDLSEETIQRFLDSCPANNAAGGSLAAAQDNTKNFYWDCSGVDVSLAVKFVYHKFNPEKSPKLSKLEEKTHEEIVLLLQHLCQKYNISEAEMQSFIDRAKREQQNASRRSSSKQNNDSKGQHHSAPSAASEYSDLTASQLSGLSPDVDTKQQLTDQQRPSTRVPFQEPDSAKEESDSAVAKRMARISREQRPRVEGGKRFTMGPVLQEFNHKAHPSEEESNHAVPHDTTDKDVRQTQQTKVQPQTDAPVQPPSHPPPPPASTGDGHRRGSLAPPPPPPPPGGSRRATTTTFQAPPPPPPLSRLSDADRSQTVTFANVEPPRKLESEESQQLRRELEMARSEIQEVTRESQEMLRLLKESTKATVSNGKSNVEKKEDKDSSHAPELSALQEKVASLSSELKVRSAAEHAVTEKFEQQKEKASTLENEVGDLKRQLKQFQDVVGKYKRKAANAQVLSKGLKKELELMERKRDEALVDRRDLLDLIEIMHSSPVSISAVLQSFLKKIGDNDVITDSAVPISDRIAKALERKREHERSVDAVLSDTLELAHGAATEEKNSRDDHDDHFFVHESSSPGARELSEKEWQMYQNMKATYSPSKQSHLMENRSDKKLSNISVKEGSSTLAKDSIMKDQYEMAKKYLKTRNAQSKLSNDIANQNLALQEFNTSKALDEMIQRESDLKQENGDQQQVQSGWITCFDPRSQRKYYYNAALKKSTWVKPVSQPRERSRGALSSNTSSRSSSPSSTRYIHSRMTTDELQLDRSSRDLSPFSGNRSDYSSTGSTSSRVPVSAASSRSNSPAASLTSVRSSSPAGSRNYSNRGRSRTRDGDRPAWVTAVDPKTQRRYWYNRETKVSTWRKPAELII